MLEIDSDDSMHEVFVAEQKENDMYVDCAPKISIGFLPHEQRMQVEMQGESYKLYHSLLDLQQTSPELSITASLVGW